MKNVLLLAMSTLGRETKDNFYLWDGTIYVGQSQLEPITHMLSDERKKNGEKLDKIIILETKATLKAEEGEKSAVEFYKERAGLFLDKNVEYVDIGIDENRPAEGIARATGIILHDYEEERDKDGRMNLWIDTQGGFRDVVMVFNAIISLLGKQGIKPAGIYSIRYGSGNTRENPCRIIDQTKNYNIFEFVSAMQEFMNYGKAGGLKKYYGEEDAFVQAVSGIADAIQMCQPQKFGDAIRKFAYYLKSGRQGEDDPYRQIFYEFMKADYGILLEDPDNTIEQIRWCVRKEFYQQAMTVYIEKMPEYYHEKGIVHLEINAETDMRLGTNPYAKAFYENMFDGMLGDEEDGKDELLNRILKDAAIEDGMGKKQAIDRIKRKAKEAGNDREVQEAVTKVLQGLEADFNQNGRIKTEQVQGSKAKTISKYVNTLCDGQGKGVRYQLLYGAEYPKRLSTYAKKVRAIQAAKDKMPGMIVEIMEYYLAMKLLRNRMNHASEDGISGEEEGAIKFLQSEGVDTGIQMGEDGIKIDYGKVKELIIKGVKKGTA